MKKTKSKNGTQRLKKPFIGYQRAQVFEQLFTPTHKATEGRKSTNEGKNDTQ